MKIICTIFVIFITLSKAENNSVQLTEIQCHTETCLRNTTFTWSIDNLDFYRPSNIPRHFIDSPKFLSPTNDKTVQWYLRVYTGDKDSDDISVFLYFSHDSKKSSVLAKFSISFLDSQRNSLKKYNSDLREFSSVEDRFGWHHLLNKDIISPDNSLNIVCDIVICECTNNVSHPNRTKTDTTLSSFFKHWILMKNRVR